MDKRRNELPRISFDAVIQPSSETISCETIASSFQNLTAGDEAGFSAFLGAALLYQRKNNPVYSRFKGYTFLPVEAFKRAAVCCFDPNEAEAVFESSGTAASATRENLVVGDTGSHSARERSKHYVRDLHIYERSVSVGFEIAFSKDPAIILGHLPSYAHSSSLVYMISHLISEKGAPGSGLFLSDIRMLENAIESSREQGHRIILFGAAFGLLDLLEERHFNLGQNAIVVETGGMKTFRREITRQDLHRQLAAGFSIPESRVRSEYGMCELMSQFYTGQDGLFYGPPWTDFRILDPLDPNRELDETEEGVLAIFDLANIHSVCAVLTEDRASRHGRGFEIHGRQENAELRGCNFLFEN